MSDTTNAIVLDTNVWLDALLPNRARRQEALELLRGAINADVLLLYPAHILPDVFYLSFVQIKHFLGARYPNQPEAVAGAARTAAWENSNFIRENAFAIEQGQGDMWHAAKIEYLHNDLEDNLVLAAVLRSRARYLVTNDQALLSHAPLAGVAAVTPRDLLRILGRGVS